MKIELKETIGEEAKLEYIDFCYGIKNRIIDAYKSFFYLRVLKTKCPIKNTMPWSEQAYVEFLIRCFQERLVLVLNKLAIDSGIEKYCVKNLKSFIEKELTRAFDKNGLALSINSDKNLDKAIKDYRNCYIAHDLKESQEISLYMPQMKSLLDEINAYYNMLLIDDLLPEKMSNTDTDICTLERFCEMGLRI